MHYLSRLHCSRKRKGGGGREGVKESRQEGGRREGGGEREMRDGGERENN